MDETSLLDGLAASDKRAFSVLFDYYWKDLYAYVNRLVKDKDESVDIVQDTFTSLWQQREQLAKVKSLKGYIYAMVHHKAILFIKNSVRHRNYLDTMASYFPESIETTEEELDAHELEMFINKEIENLPPRMREIFLLSRFEQLSYKEIAIKLAIAENTVRKQISFSLKYLRMKLSKTYYSSVVTVVTLAKLLGY